MVYGVKEMALPKSIIQILEMRQMVEIYWLKEFPTEYCYCKASPHTNLILYSIYPCSFPPMPCPRCLILSTDL
jgi:hypothetical protein